MDLNIFLSSIFSDIIAEISRAGFLVYISCLIFLILAVVGGVLNSRVKKTFLRYSQVTSSIGKTAAEVAREMLDDAGLTHVIIKMISGDLTGNFDTSENSISLSVNVYDSMSVSAIAIACHECGHAIQYHKSSHTSLRAKLSPVMNFSQMMVFPLVMAGIAFSFFIKFPVISAISPFTTLLACIFFGIYMIIALVSLPTELDANKRAKVYLAQFTGEGEKQITSKALFASAMTYIVYALMALFQFFRFFKLLC